MNIKEAEKLSGVSVRNIRFYEQKGLIKPARNAENDYREYCDEDIRLLKLIRALRMVDMPLEQIKQVLDGDISLQDAVTQQRKIIKDKIKKLETAAYFCEEIAKPEQDFEEVLRRMDEPENRKILSKRWNFDYADWARKTLLPLGAGLLPLIAGAILYIPMLFAGLLVPAYLISFALLVLGVWGYLGYRLYSQNRWKKNLILFFVFPLAALLLQFVEQIPVIVRNIYTLYFLHAVFLGNELELWPNQQNIAYILGFWVNAACFFLGFLIRASVEKKRAAGREPAVARWFSERPKVTLALICVLVIALLIPPAFFVDIGPADGNWDPDHMYGRYAYTDNCLAATEDSVVWFETSEEFAELARFDEWERKYTWFGSGKEVLTIDKDDIKRYANLEFYNGDYVKVNTRGFLGPVVTQYFSVPEGVIEALTEYVKDNTIKDGSAWG